MKKYELTNNWIIFKGRTLYQIRALKDFDNVKAGDLGGYIEKESNLSQEGNCWAFGNARLYGNARVYGYLKVYCNAEAYDDVNGNDVVKNDAEVNTIEQPKHYDLTIQPIDYIVANKLDFVEGNVIKYVSRYKLKNGKEDLLKAKYYLDLLIKQFDKQQHK